MPKKSLKDAAQAGTSVFDTIAAGNTAYGQQLQDRQDAQDVLNVQVEQTTWPEVRPTTTTPAITTRGPGRPKKLDGPEIVRLNLKIPVEIREYLQAAAYRESSPKHMVSLTEYLCDLIRKDMELHKDD